MVEEPGSQLQKTLIQPVKPSKNNANRLTHRRPSGTVPYDKLDLGEIPSSVRARRNSSLSSKEEGPVYVLGKKSSSAEDTETESKMVSPINVANNQQQFGGSLGWSPSTSPQNSNDSGAQQQQNLGRRQMHSLSDVGAISGSISSDGSGSGDLGDIRERGSHTSLKLHLDDPDFQQDSRTEKDDFVTEFLGRRRGLSSNSPRMGRHSTAPAPRSPVLSPRSGRSDEENTGLFGNSNNNNSSSSNNIKQKDADNPFSSNSSKPFSMHSRATSSSSLMEYGLRAEDLKPRAPRSTSRMTRRPSSAAFVDRGMAFSKSPSRVLHRNRTGTAPLPYVPMSNMYPAPPHGLFSPQNSQLRANTGDGGGREKNNSFSSHQDDASVSPHHRDLPVLPPSSLVRSQAQMDHHPISPRHSPRTKAAYHRRHMNRLTELDSVGNFSDQSATPTSVSSSSSATSPSTTTILHGRRHSMQSINLDSLDGSQQQQHDRKFDLNRIRIGQEIARGSFGAVHQALDMLSGARYAVKRILCTNNGIRSAITPKIEEEINVMRKLSHPNIVEYLGSQLDAATQNLDIYMEFVAGGSIATMIKEYGALSDVLVSRFTRDILCGVAFLHENHIIHRDIKGGNVLISLGGQAKLADFGTAKNLAELNSIDKDTLKNIRGSVPWMAPEMVQEKGVNFKADIWSLGATVLEMKSGKRPWAEYTDTVGLIFKIGQNEEAPPIHEDTHPLVRQFMDSCFQLDPDNRPTARMLLNDEFILAVST